MGLLLQRLLDGQKIPALEAALAQVQKEIAAFPTTGRLSAFEEKVAREKRLKRRLEICIPMGEYKKPSDKF